MSHKIEIILFIMFVVSFCFANRIIAKDSTPGGIYIIGPDVSPDSTDLTLLYYSPDAGTTLIIRDTFYFFAEGIAVDRVDSVLYLLTNAINISYDYGKSWELRDYCERRVPYAGNIPGEVLLGAFSFSHDFCETSVLGEMIGIDGPANCYAGSGQPGESYFVSMSGNLFYSWCYADTFIMTNNVGGANVTVGNLQGELWMRKRDSLFFSENYGSTFVYGGIIPIPFSHTIGECSDFDFIRGDTSGSLFICNTHINNVPMIGIFGGYIKICYTNDYGVTFNCVEHGWYDSTSSIENVPKLPKTNSILLFPNPFTNFIETNVPVVIYDISGKEVARGQGKLDLSKLSPGLYFAKWYEDREAISKKILKIK